MPQAWATRMPARMKRSTIDRGIAEPPQTTCFSVSGMGFACASRCWSIDSHTVGTPAAALTFSRSNRSHSTAGSLTAE